MPRNGCPNTATTRWRSCRPCASGRRRRCAQPEGGAAPSHGAKWQHTRPDGSLADEEELTPTVLIDLFLHGKYLHKGNEKSDKLAAWPLAHLLQDSFFGAIKQLSQIYWVGRNVVAEVLKVPALLRTPESPLRRQHNLGDVGTTNLTVKQPQHDTA